MKQYNKELKRIIALSLSKELVVSKSKAETIVERNS